MPAVPARRYAQPGCLEESTMTSDPVISVIIG